jgi:hypothetical protein
MAVASVVAITVPASAGGSQRSPGGGDPTAAHLAGGVVQSPLRPLCRLDEAQLAGAGRLGRLGVWCIHEFDYAEGV